MVEHSNSFFATTRGRIVTMLRPGPRTVEEMATELGVTDNAVRAQLQGLERDGLVRPAGSRRGGGAGKPPTIYELTPEAEERLSHAFAPFLEAVLATTAEQVDAAQMERILGATGVRLARAHPAPPGTDRVAHAVQVLNALGGTASAQREGAVTVIAAPGCALGPVVAHHPETCHAMRAFLAEVTGRPVREECAHEPRAKCRFVVEADGRTGGQK